MTCEFGFVFLVAKERRVTMSVSDLELIELIKGGDAAAFGVFDERWRPVIFGVLCGLLSCPEQADDLSQETMIRAWTKIGSYDSNYEVSRWLIRIAKNCMIDYLRSESSRLKCHQRSYVDMDESFSYKDEYFTGELSEVVRRELEGLPASLRESCVLRLQGKNLEEISVEVGVPLRTVQSRMRLARERLVVSSKLREYVGV